MSRTARILDLVIIVALVLYAAVGIGLFWTSPNALALPLLLPAAVIALRVGSWHRAATLAFTGLLLGPLTEALCVAGGLWSYPVTGGLPYVPLWIVPLWAAFPGALWIAVRSVLGADLNPEVRPRALLWALVALGIEIALFVGLGHSTPLALSAAIPMAALLLLISRRRESLLLFVVGAILGPVCEAVPNAAGAFIYSLPELFGMPLWLPLAYAIFSLCVALAAEAACALVARRLASTSAVEQLPS